MTHDPSSGLLDRGPELAQLAGLLGNACAGSGSVLLIEGEAGIGKTSLLAALAERAESAGARVLRARGGFLEREFSHGVVRQLFDGVVRSRALPAGAAEQAASALGLATQSGLVGQDAMFAANHGLYWLTVELADERPLVLLVDDVHWSDVASLHFLNYLGTRIDESPVLTAMAMRPAEPGSPRALLDTIRALPSAVQLRPSGLTEASTGTLVDRISGGATTSALHKACWAVTGGNPFLVRELLRALPLEGDQIELADRVHRLGPRSVARSVLGRVATLFPEASALAEAVSVLDTDAELRHAAKIAGLSLEAAQVAADALADAAVLAAERPLRFAHPLIRQAVYDDMPTGRRAAHHEQAARILDAEGADPDRAVVHLLETEPSGDEWVVDKLRSGAARALARGSPDTASRLLRRALAEPPGPPVRPSVLFELGRAAVMAVEPDGIDILAEAVDAAPDSGTKVEATDELANALIWFGDSARAMGVLTSTADAVRDRDLDGWMRLQSSTLNLLSFTEQAPDWSNPYIEELRPGLTGATAGERGLLAALTLQRVICMSATADEMIDLAQRAVANGFRSGEAWANELFIIGPVFVFCCYDRHDLMAAVDEAMEEHARRVGSRVAADLLRGIRGIAANSRGDVAEMLDAYDRIVEAELGPLPMYELIAHKAFVFLEQGRVAEAYEAFESHGLLDSPLLPISQARQLLVARANVKVLSGRKAEALADAREAASRKNVHFGIAVGFERSPALALRAAGAADEALDYARQEVAMADRVKCRSVAGQAALVLGMCSPRDDALDHFANAVEKLDSSPKRRDLAHALVEYGAALRRANRRSDARPHLERGMELAHRIAAHPLAERARSELVACGARPRRFVVTGADSLTTVERRVGEMAASGLTNTEIAQALFITRKTVETHLGRVYRKLNIASRTDLPRALGDAEP